MTHEPTSSTTSSELGGALWHTSSFSGSNNNCVEHAPLFTGRQAVRDTKDRTGGTLIFEAPAWRDFVTALRNGEFDL